MRIGALVLPIAAALAAAATAAAATPASTAYIWAQPGAATLGNPFAEPPLWLRPLPVERFRPPVDDGYVWAQPGSAPVSAPDAQPWSL